MSLCMRRGTGQINQLDATRTIPSRGVVAAGSRTPYFPPFSTQVVSLSGPLCSRTPPSPPFPLQRVSRRSVAACLPFGSAGYQQLGSLPFGGAVCNVLLMIVLVLVRVCFVLVAAKSSLAPFFVHFDCTMPVDPRSSFVIWKFNRRYREPNGRVEVQRTEALGREPTGLETGMPKTQAGGSPTPSPKRLFDSAFAVPVRKATYSAFSRVIISGGSV
ncbi:hypothetical protein HDV57DRAFT_80474 [Trichoderma longibrachiatum]|uniref:Transmembrane protein n=1 Tax=Trichoderma longibrachiatum ATCC 18648 TaxID=983965 RepID=A0A2T4BV67_TRILO|nr:hypothetical protein M440DRAFT_143692 [Trichoderma longibrachiatum ATCC 18648]